MIVHMLSCQTSKEPLLFHIPAFPSQSRSWGVPRGSWPVSRGAGRQKSPRRMAKPDPAQHMVYVPVWLFGAVVFCFVVAAGVFLYCIAEVNPKPLKVVDSDAAVKAVEDAFKLKEDRKRMLLEQARARYLKLNPSFVPPSKVKSL